MVSGSYLLSGLLLLVLELLYFRVARYYHIIDVPNSRSSHSQPVIRGGGIVFPISVLVWFGLAGFTWPWFVAGVVVIAIISFLDDVRVVPPAVRAMLHLLAIVGLFFQAGIFTFSPVIWIPGIIISVGTLNAFNFMDGINGMTGSYGWVTAFSLLVIHLLFPFTDTLLIGLLMVSLFVFLIFNFRKRAVCFAGDVGSVVLSAILVFLVLQLMVYTHSWIWILLFVVYGIETIFTIIFRLVRKENIFSAHRTHLYQLLSNELQITQLKVSAGYALIQLAFNAILLWSYRSGDTYTPLLAGVAMGAMYLWVRGRVLGKVSKLHV